MFYGFALFEEFVGTDPLGRGRIHRIFVAGVRSAIFVTFVCNHPGEGCMSRRPSGRASVTWVLSTLFSANGARVMY